MSYILMLRCLLLERATFHSSACVCVCARCVNVLGLHEQSLVSSGPKEKIWLVSVQFSCKFNRESGVKTLVYIIVLYKNLSKYPRCPRSKASYKWRVG